MVCCQCQGIEEVFNEKYVTNELSRYRRNGPDKTTRILLGALKQEGVLGLTLLDIGGGVGAIQHDLINAGVTEATDVDASAAYMNAARSEAQRRGYAGRVSYRHGNFVDMAAEISPADIVTLERVICCYPEMEKMVALSAARARKIYGLVFPRDDGWVKLGSRVMNLFFKLIRSPYRNYIHPSKGVEAILDELGFKRRFLKRTLVWQVLVYTRG